MFLRHAKVLANITSAITTLTNGAAKQLVTSNADDQRDTDQRFYAIFELNAADGSSPTLNARLESSWDGGATWHTVAAMTALSGAGTKNELVAITAIGPLIRTVIVPGGSTAPNVTGQILLASTGLINVT